jgi:predicted anti-sigma-YlaC factor YlaD
MSEHPAADVLVAYADGERADVDLDRIAAHVVTCVQCRRAIGVLQRVHAAVAEAAQEPPSAIGGDGWSSLATRIEQHRRTRARSVAWARGVAAAVVVASVLLLRGPRWNSTGEEPALLRREADAPPVVSLGEGAETLERTIAARRSRLSGAEVRTLESIVAPIDAAIRQTESTIRGAPTDSFVREHLAALQRQRAAALADFVDLIRDRG